MTRRTNIMGVIVALASVLLTVGASCDAQAVTNPFDGNPSRWVIAHRGGARWYPEEGYRGYSAAMNSGFALEADARQLKDGLWVLNHDATVDRTIRGLTGPVDQITREQWMASTTYLRPDPDGRFKWDHPATLGGWFLRYGGKIPLVLELKAGSVPSFINMIKSRNFEKVVLAQTFNWETAQQFQEAGLTTMFLMGSDLNKSPANEYQIRDAGIRYVGVSRNMGAWHVQRLRNAGLIVVSYTVDTQSNFSYELGQGVNGSFSNNPWALR